MLESGSGTLKENKMINWSSVFGKLAFFFPALGLAYYLTLYTQSFEMGSGWQLALIFLAFAMLGVLAIGSRYDRFMPTCFGLIFGMSWGLRAYPGQGNSCGFLVITVLLGVFAQVVGRWLNKN